MRVLIISMVLSSVFAGVNLQAQTIADSVYYERLYYTGKVWGYVKYFHSEIAKGKNNWDMKLIEALPDIKSSVSDQDFNRVLSSILDTAGEMAQSIYKLPDLPDSLKYNLDLNWLDDSIFSMEVREKLDTIKSRFRVQKNYYVGEAWSGGNPTFDNDKQFHEWGINQYPEEEYRLLALFRYWNIINYFYPFKYIMDQDWDSVLIEFIPKVLNVKDEMSFHLTFIELTTRLNDSHTFLFSLPNSKIIDEVIFGQYFLPITLKHVENETVVTGVLKDNTSIEVGDIIKSVNGHDIYTLRDSLKKYTAGSNDPVIERNINWRILMGPDDTVQMTLVSAEGQKDVILSRNISSDYYDFDHFIEEKDFIWKTLNTKSRIYGYVNMGRLEIAQIDSMFNDLWDTDAIIFDLRNYPRPTMWHMINYLFDKPIHNVEFTVPNIRYPGTLYWQSETVGSGDFSKTYDTNIFILFDELTQSLAEYTVMTFEQHPKAFKIGSQTAGVTGNVSELYLPGGIVAYFTGLGSFYPDYTETQRIGIIPDIEIHPTIAGIREGRDEVLEAALAYNITSSTADTDFAYQFLAPRKYLLQNYPNPFKETTNIEFVMPASEFVTLKIYNGHGQEVTSLVSAKLLAGKYSYSWDAGTSPAGIYICILNAGGEIESRKMTLLR